MKFNYWIFFEKDREPIRIRAEHFEEFKLILDRLVYERSEMFEWMIRDYSRG